MSTLQDYMLVTKAEEYLIAVIFLMVFPLFWRYLNTPSKAARK